MADIDQRLQLIAQTFAEVNHAYFDGVIPAPAIILNTKMTHTAGRVWIDQWTMEISSAYHDHYGWEAELVCTVKHEVIHLYLAHMKRPSGHTKEFKAICARIGTSRWCRPMPRRRPRYLYLVQCPQCHVPRWRGSWSTGLACGECCDRYNDGRYSPQFGLTLVKREIVHETPRRGPHHGHI
jgi:predicted SprT family Zn-dependent metalloprotease